MKAIPVKNPKTGDITSYQLRAYVGKNANGKPKLVTKTWRPDKKYTEKQLEKELQRQQTLFEDSAKSNNAYTDKITFKEFAEKWIKDYAQPNRKERTTDSYKSMLKRINPAIGHIQIGKLGPTQINSFLLNLKEEGVKLTDKTHKSGLSDKSVKNYYTLISSILSTAVKWKVIKDNPINGVEPPKVVKKKVNSLEKENTMELFKLLDVEPIKYQLFIKVAIHSGMRRAEILGLKWSKLDFANHLIVIDSALLYTPEKGIYEDTPKTPESIRTIKLSSQIFNLFNKHKQQQDEIKEKLGEDWVNKDYIFTQWNGEPMHPNTPYSWFTKFQKRHGLEHCSIHMLRHTTATLLIMEGVNIKSVSSRLGHSNTSTTTNIYTSYLKSADEMVSDALDDILGLPNE